LVVFDWNDDGVSDHIGLVKSIDGQSVQTVEFNTRADGASAGGYVLQKNRDLKLVRGFVDLYK